MKYIIWIIIIAVVAGGGWLYWQKQAQASAAASNAPPTLDVIKRRTIEKVVSANGKIASNRDVDIKCQASGTIKTLPYTDVAKEVKPDELVCQLDPVDMKRLVDTAKAVVDGDKSRLEEAKLNRDLAKMSLDTTRQRNEASLASAKAQAADAHSKADRTRQLFEAKPTALASKEDLDTAVTTATLADASVETAQAAIAELDQLSKQIDIKEQQINEMDSTLAQDQSRYDTAVQNMDYCTVRAPKADDPSDPPRWFITSLLTNIAPGYVVQSGTSGFSAGTTIMTLSDLSHIFCLANVYESDESFLTNPEVTKQRVRVKADSFPGVIFMGETVRVAQKGTTVNNVTTFEVKIEITSENRILLRPEMTTTVEIIAGSRSDVLTVPASDFARTGNSEKGGHGAATGAADVGGGPGATQSAMAASAPMEMPAPAATEAATTSAPSTRRGRGGGGGGRSSGGGGGQMAVSGAPQSGTVMLYTDAGGAQQHDVVVGLLGTDPNDPGAGDLYELISGLSEGDSVIKQNGGDSRFRNQGPNAQQLMRGITGGGRGR